MQTTRSEMPAKRTFETTKPKKVFGQPRKQPKMLRAGLYARVSTHDQKTLPMQMRIMREYASNRGWTITIQIKEVGSGAVERELRVKLMEAARRREIDVVLVSRLDRWGRSLADLVVTLNELNELGVGFVSLNEALDLRTPHGPRPGRSALGVRGVRTRHTVRACARWTGRSATERNATGSACNGC
jgi:Resolvase, N terminal domain